MVDHLASQYPWNSTFAFSENRVIDALELEGLESVLVHGTYAKRKDKAILSLDIADYKGGSTWDRVFSQRISKSAGWNGNSTFEFTWSGKNKAIDRIEAGAALAHKLMSDDNPFKENKHATLIGHSHGGNVNKIAKNILEKNGWTVDIINISTPQRLDFQQDQKGTGVNLNFLSNSDLIQWIGVDNFSGKGDSALDTGSRIDNKSSNFLVKGTNLIINWVKNAAGHSYHQDSKTQRQIEKTVEKEFNQIVTPNKVDEKTDSP